MPQLAIAAAGAAVGAGIGGTFLGVAAASWGWMAGSLVGGLLFAPKGPKAQLADLRAPKLQMGSKLHRVYGTVRVPLSPRWQSDWRARKNSAGGKGGGGSEYYTYSCDVLYWVSDIAGLPADLRVKGWARIFWNGELVATRLAESDADSITATDEDAKWDDVQFFDGNPAQLPWAIYETAVGAANADAHRRVACVGIENLQTGTWSNLPLLEAEVYTAGTDGGSALAEKYADNVAEVLFHGPALRPFGALDFGATSTIVGISPDTTAEALQVVPYDVDLAGVETQTGVQSISIAYDTSNPGQGNGAQAVMVLGRREITRAGVAIVGDGISQTIDFAETDSYIGTSDIRFSTYGARIAVGTAAAIGATPPDVSGDGYAGNQGLIWVYDIAGTPALVDTIAAGIAVECLALGSATVWALSSGAVHPFTIEGAAGASFAAPASTIDIFVSTGGVLHAITSAGVVHKYVAGAWSEVATLVADDAADLTTGCRYAATGSHVYVAKGVTADVEELTDRFIIRAFSGTHDTLAEAILAYGSYWFNSFTWGESGAKRQTRNHSITIAPYSPPFSTAVEAWQVTYACERLYGYDGDTQGTFDDPYDEWFWSPTDTSIIIDRYVEVAPKTKYYHDLYRQQIGGVTPGTVDLADIVSAECLRCGLTADDIDVTELQGIEVRGFIAQGSAREALEDLMAIFHFYCVCSDRLHFRLLDAASVAALTFARTGGGVEQPGPPFTGVERGNDLEVPSEITLVSPNPSADYDAGAETSDRLVTAGRKKETVQSLVVLTPEERKGRANAFALDARTGMHIARLTFDDTYAELEPGDVVTPTDDEGNSYIVRIVRETYADGVHDCEVRLFNRTDLVQTGTTSDTYSPVINIAPVALTELVLLDSGLLRDEDDGAHLLAAGKPASAGKWPRAGVYRSVDDATFSSVATLAARAVIGQASTALADFSAWTWDEHNTVTVNVGGQTLTSSSRTAMQADPTINVAAIGADGRWEIIRFRTATLVSAGVYTLSGLLRGLRGTDAHRGSHQVGDTFVVLDAATLARISVSPAELGLTRYWKGVTAGKPISSVSSQALSPDGVSLKPWSPTRLRVERDGSNNATLSWSRRTRLAVRHGGMPGSYVPLGEASEAYEVDVYADGTFTVVVRTISASSETASYTAAEQTTDGLTPGDPIYVRIYQLSAIVGRGYPLEASA